MKVSKNLLAELYLGSHVVRSGPFRGTHVASYSETVGRPKWLGTYEMELHPAWRSILDTSPRTILDIGGAEGYYACGLLRALPHAHVDVWEALDRERELLRLNARANGVGDRCTIHGFCDDAALGDAITRSAPDLVICDIEGGEHELLSEAMLHRLRSAALVVETHGRDVFESLLTRVRQTHDADIIEPRPRTSSDWPLPWYLYATPTLKHWAMQEHRVLATPWIVGWPRRA